MSSGTLPEHPCPPFQSPQAPKMSLACTAHETECLCNSSKVGMMYSSISYVSLWDNKDEVPTPLSELLQERTEASCSILLFPLAVHLRPGERRVHQPGYQMRRRFGADIFLLQLRPLLKEGETGHATCLICVACQIDTVKMK